MRTIFNAVLLGVILAGSFRLAADEVSSDVFGYCSLTMIGNSDTYVSIPFARLAATTTVVGSATNNTVTVSGSPGWTAGQFIYAQGSQSNTYYLRFNSGALEGRMFDVTNNTTNALSLNLNGGSLSGVLANDSFSVVPYWTMGTVFQNGNGVHASSSTLTHRTEVLVPDLSSSGINLSTVAAYYYLTNATGNFWRKTGSSVTNLNDDIIQPNSYLIIRHKIATNTTFIAFGNVLLTKVSIPIKVNTTNKQDNFVGLLRPINVALSNATLIESGAFAASASSLTHKDELLAFDNTTTNQNKSATAVYYYFNSAWRQQGLSASLDVGPSNIFVPGNGYIIRKAPTNTTVRWLNSPTY